MQHVQQNNTMKVGQFRIEKVLKQGNFARVLIVSLLIMFPVQVMAQASGGQIRRNNTTSTAIKKKRSLIFLQIPSNWMTEQLCNMKLHKLLT